MKRLVNSFYLNGHTVVVFMYTIKVKIALYEALLTPGRKELTHGKEQLQPALKGSLNRQDSLPQVISIILSLFVELFR